MRREAGSATLESVLAITILVPVLFAILQFGAAFQRWMAQDAAAALGARQAAELGGDGPAVREAIDASLRASGLDPAKVTVAVEPSVVRWREPLRVTLRSEALVAVPFVFTAAVPLVSTTVARGEIAR